MEKRNKEAGVRTNSLFFLNVHIILKFIISGFLVSCIFSGQIPSEYFQQFVEYEIDVELNDENHTLSAYLKLNYTNNSNDKLDFIWFHLWPNAYKNNETAFAKQRLRLGSTKFHYSDRDDQGYIDSLGFKVNNEKLELSFHPKWIDVAKVSLNKPLNPGETISIETPFL